MAIVVTRVKVDDREVQIKESFLSFFSLHEKSTKEITKFIFEEFQENVLDVTMSTSLPYDSISMKAGINSEVQGRIEKDQFKNTM